MGHHGGIPACSATAKQPSFSAGRRSFTCRIVHSRMALHCQATDTCIVCACVRLPWVGKRMGANLVHSERPPIRRCFERRRSAYRHHGRGRSNGFLRNRRPCAHRGTGRSGRLGALTVQRQYCASFRRHPHRKGSLLPTRFPRNRILLESGRYRYRHVLPHRMRSPRGSFLFRAGCEERGIECLL